MKYSLRAALFCCACYLALLALSLIPPQRVLGVELRRINVLSDLVKFESEEQSEVEHIELEIEEREYDVDLEKVRLEVEATDSATPASQSSYSWHEEGVAELFTPRDSSSVVRLRPAPQTLRLTKRGELTSIEDYDTLPRSALRRLYRKLLSPDSLVRIAVLGDSFIEADILTADLREVLQSQYGGCGVGFAPIHSPLTAYRRTIKTSAKGWTTHNVMQHRKTPAPLSELYSVTGWVSGATAGATTTWSATSVRQHIDSCTRVKIHFVARHDARLEISVNGEQSRSFEIEGGQGLRQIEIEQPCIKELSLRVVAGASGFVGYGAYFESTEGVVLDNYSVRSNNGQAMFWTSAAINAQLGKALGGYDLVILQYGLNIMQSGVNGYTRYGASVEKMIRYINSCFPSAAVLVLGVSDRSYKIDGRYQPMREALSLTSYQRQAAKNCGVGFWETYAAMQEQGGMSSFVERGWAAKDFTHINFEGGRAIAFALFDAIVEGVERERQTIVVKEEREPLIDSAKNQTIERELLHSLLNE